MMMMIIGNQGLLYLLAFIDCQLQYIVQTHKALDLNGVRHCHNPQFMLFFKSKDMLIVFSFEKGYISKNTCIKNDIPEELYH